MAQFKPEYLIGGITLLLIGIGLVTLLLTSPSTMSDVSVALGSKEEPYKEIVNPSGFVNTDGITIGELVGKKIVLVDFLTYSCINCQRTFPYLNAWYEKYKDEGLEIVGIHTPEFAFERDLSNVRNAMKQFGIEYPIVLDNDYATWGAYGNRFWPRKYLIDIHGNIVYDHIGEGAYAETEKRIQLLLEERARVLGQESSIDSSLATESVREVAIEANSPETYFGSSRNEYLGNGVPGTKGTRDFSTPMVTLANRLYLTGTWDIQSEYAETVSDSSVLYSYTAKNVYIVAEADSLTQIEVYQDGSPVTVSKGDDVSGTSTLQVQESRLYSVIKNSKAESHTLELRVKGRGVRIYTFTFG